MIKLETTLNVPLTQWEDGSIRITDSRVTIDSILRQFKLGATAERIQDSFPSLTLPEIYGAIFYYLENIEAVEEYLRQRDEAVEEGKRFIEQHFDTKALRERILARRAQLARTA
ncbi:MAG: DUF433 domain-containing protein [Blastocatellales bacterium]